MTNSRFRLTAVSGFTFIIALCYGSAIAQKSNDAPPFETAKQLIAKKRFSKANKVLKKYQVAHPADMNASWLRAQVQLFRGNNRQSAALYRTAIKLQPANDYLKLNYIHALADMGRTDEATTTLQAMENAGGDYSDMDLLRARIYYYTGDNKKAAAYAGRALQNNWTAEGADLNDEVALARAAHISLNAAYLSDDQPIKMLTTGVKAEKSFSRAFTPYVEAGDNHFAINAPTNEAPWLRVGDKLFFPKAGLRINISGGAARFPVKSDIAWLGAISLNEKLSQQFDIDLAADHSPYFGTLSALDTNISATRFSAALNWHKAGWLAQAAAIDNTYGDGNNVYTTYAYFLAPVVVFPTGKLQLGLSGGYSNADVNKYQPAKTLGEVLAAYTPNMTIGGEYMPYFTPYNQYTGSVLLSFRVNVSKDVSINVNGDVGRGSTYNPYFFLDKDAAGNVFISKGYATDQFTPYSASAGINYRIGKSWMLSGKYTRRSTYFFNSDYATIGIDKSFLPHKRNAGHGKSAFSRAVQGIEDKIQALYRCKNQADLKTSVSDIRSQLVQLRDAQKKKMSMTEVTPGSLQYQQLQDRYTSLDDMIAEIDSVDINDLDSKENKKEWLTSKEFELASVHYNGADEE